VRSSGRLGDAEGLQPQFASSDCRQKRTLLLGRSVAQQGAHRVHLRVGRARVSAAKVDLLENDRRFGHAQAGSAEFLGNERRQVAGLGQRANEGVRVGARRVELAPVAVGKRFAEIANRGSQILMEIGRRHAAIIEHVENAKLAKSAKTYYSSRSSRPLRS